MIEAEWDNVRAAWDNALTAEQFDAIDQSFEALALFCFVRTAHNSEGEYLLQQAIDRVRPCATTSALRALLGQLLARAAFFSSYNLHLEAARLAFSEADKLLQANATEYEQAAGHLWWARARLFYFDAATGQERDQLQARLQHDIGIFELNNDSWSVAIAEASLASINIKTHNFSTAQHLAERALSRFQSLGVRFLANSTFGRTDQQREGEERVHNRKQLPSANQGHLRRIRP